MFRTPFLRHARTPDGDFYDPIDPELVAAQTRASDLCQALNATREAFGKPVHIGSDV